MFSSDSACLGHGFPFLSTFRGPEEVKTGWGGEGSKDDYGRQCPSPLCLLATLIQPYFWRHWTPTGKGGGVNKCGSRGFSLSISFVFQGCYRHLCVG